MTETSHAESEWQPIAVDSSVQNRAHDALVEMVDDPHHVGDFVVATQAAENVVDLRFASHITGYEGWQWSITLYHDVEADRWTIDESCLVPTSEALLAPEWIPWKDRLIPSDISPTDVLGTEPDDNRLEPGANEETLVVAEETSEGVEVSETSTSVDDSTSTSQPHEGHTADSQESRESRESLAEEERPKDQDSEPSNSDQSDSDQSDSEISDFRKTVVADEVAEAREIIEDFELSRSRVLSPLGRAQTADRWYTGPHGPKSLSTRAAGEKTCQTCGFFVQIHGELGTMFGVCANKWSQDDGRVVSLDHGCGEHSDIEPPVPSTMWIQPDPAVDDKDDIIIVPRPPRTKPSAEERRIAEILEEADDVESLDESSSTEVSEDTAESVEDAAEDAAEDETVQDTAESTKEFSEEQSVQIDNSEPAQEIVAVSEQLTEGAEDTEETEDSEDSAEEEPSAE